MNKLFLTTLLCLAALLTQAQTGQPFPEVSGTTLTGKSMTVPKDTQGKYTLLGLAYSKKSQDDLETWFQPVYSTFLDKNRSMWEVSSYNVNIYFIPMISGIKEAASGKIEKRLKKELDPALQPHVLFYTGSIKEYKDALNLGKKDEPYFFVLDADGKVVYATQGAYSDKKMEEVESYLEEE
ncbi:ATP10 protein [Catalinimonas alkaloidigena]|uniref:ATP10 protein n=1 Tax=Catalinimonas alkaloidigena TaxID=1075417 RepID=A0A1G8XUH9_9BACT|nr:hypothetical protein [Catalinimonas alkaloidigena]SDJ94173.1 ATP10 protein [Catalinimonas alkaloidigena]